MADPCFLLATAIDDSAEALYRIVADIPDPVAKARVALSAVEQIQGHLLPDLVSIRRAAIREARQRMSAQELADRRGMSDPGCTPWWQVQQPRPDHRALLLARTTRPVR
jgi:hypothetical protein